MKTRTPRLLFAVLDAWARVVADMLSPSVLPAKLRNCGLSLLVFMGLAFSVVQAVEGPPVTHGSQLTAAMVGPGAIGITSFSVQPNPSQGYFSIYDETSYSFITKVNTSATYDGIVVNGPHLLVQGIEFHVEVDDNAALPLVVRGCKFMMTSQVNAGIWGKSSAPLYVLYCDLSMANSGLDNGEFIWIGSSNSVALRNHLHNFTSDGIEPDYGSNIQILENLMDQLTPGSGAHPDGIQMNNSAQGVSIKRNKILMAGAATSTINLWYTTNNYAHNTVIDSNYLSGGAYCLYGSPAGANNSFTNNIFGLDFWPNGPGGQWGVVYGGSWPSYNPWVNNSLSNGTLVDYQGNPISGTGAPTITTQPANKTVTVGETATFSIVASGNPTPTYQWQKNNVNISGATSASYTTPATVIGDNGSTFRCIASNSAGSVTSNAATLTVNAAGGGLPSPWVNQDIGTVGLTGSSSYSGSTFTVAGAGANIWGTADAFQYASQPVSGDGTIIARVASQSGGATTAKACVMVRESTAAGSAHVSMELLKNGTLELDYRAATGGASAKNASVSGISAPYWLKLVRSGSTFSGYYSSNGSTWTQLGTSITTVTMGINATMGLGVCSLTTGALETATFDNVTVTP